ncbi:13785_t:CDS:1 [Rhizophagus irregularis]|nr:13785_t:CDS:1 [Rhizophagus irregularis]
MRDFVVQIWPLTKDQLNFLYKKVLKFIVEDSQPFYILESKSFKELLLLLHLFFELLTDKVLENLLNNMFKAGQTQLKDIFEKVEKISLTTDFWTSRGQQKYIGVTAYWISNDFNLKKAFLTLQHTIHYSHTSEVIKEKLKDIIGSRNIYTGIN